MRRWAARGVAGRPTGRCRPATTASTGWQSGKFGNGGMFGSPCDFRRPAGKILGYVFFRFVGLILEKGGSHGT